MFFDKKTNSNVTLKKGVTENVGATVDWKDSGLSYMDVETNTSGTKDQKRTSKFLGVSVSPFDLLPVLGQQS